MILIIFSVTKLISRVDLKTQKKLMSSHFEVLLSTHRAVHDAATFLKIATSLEQYFWIFARFSEVLLNPVDKALSDKTAL